MSRQKRNAMMWKCMVIYVIALLAILLVACVRKEGQKVGVPRPMAYPRVERSYDTVYSCVYAPLNIELNRNVEVVRTDSAADAGGFRAAYPHYGAELLCSYHRTGNAAQLKQLLARRMERVALDLGNKKPDVFRHDYSDGGSATVFYSLRDCVTPVHFVATDSVDYVVSGTVVLDRISNFDSIAPVLDYLSFDVAHLVKNLNL